jgi:hypothetical protein
VEPLREGESGHDEIEDPMQTTIPGISDVARHGIRLGETEAEIDRAFETFGEAVVAYAAAVDAGEEFPEAHLGLADYEFDRVIRLRARVAELRNELGALAH